MPVSPSLLSFEDCQVVMDRALESEIGIAITLETPGAAVHFRQRCYKFRNLSHSIARKAFDDGDPRSQASPYDALIVTISRSKKNVIEIRRRENIKFDITELLE